MVNTEEMIRKIDERLKELENNKYYHQQKKEIIEKIECEINDLHSNIETIYNKYLEELNNLVGLDNVKVEIKKLIDYLLFLKKTNYQLKLDNINLNMVFRGNPGTGKTTVARIVAKILYELGFVKSDKVIETTPRDFIAGFVGQTAIKARNTIDSALGGVIFIDEAYTFSQSLEEDGNTFVYEAITEIIKEMESLNIVFISSVYNKEMEKFININPGLKSRIGYNISFSDYTKEELFTMFINKVKKSGMKLSDKAKEVLLEKISEYITRENHGNGRMIDNLFNEVVREHASTNLFENNYQKLLVITDDSIRRIKVKCEKNMNFE